MTLEALSNTHSTLASVFQDEATRLTALLVRVLGDFDVAQEIVQDTMLVALEHWPVEGVPEYPSGWLLTVARRRAIDQIRRDARLREKLSQLEQPEPQEPDDRLRLIFTCCHPSLSREAQVALIVPDKPDHSSPSRLCHSALLVPLLLGMAQYRRSGTN